VLDRGVVLDISHVGRGNIDIQIIARGDTGILDRFRAATSADAGRLRGRRRSRCGRCGRGSRRSATPPRGRRRLLLGADPLLTLPARANTRDLVVRE
jgi:hypothetical protein